MTLHQILEERKALYQALEAWRRLLFKRHKVKLREELACFDRHSRVAYELLDDMRWPGKT